MFVICNKSNTRFRERERELPEIERERESKKRGGEKWIGYKHKLIEACNSGMRKEKKPRWEVNARLSQYQNNTYVLWVVTDTNTERERFLYLPNDPKSTLFIMLLSFSSLETNNFYFDYLRLNFFMINIVFMLVMQFIFVM